MLDSTTVMPGEGQVCVEGGVTDTLRCLRYGDPTAGWEGDENMQLLVDLETGLYDVWTLDARGEPGLVVGQRPYADHRLIVDVVLADSRRFDVIGRIDARNAANEKAAKQKLEDARAAAAEKLRWALMKDVGHLYGGLTKEFH